MYLGIFVVWALVGSVVAWAVLRNREPKLIRHHTSTSAKIREGG
jgi:hypothetical protein